MVRRFFLMALILTPGQLTQRGEFYYQLAQLTGAGVPLTNALDHLQRQQLGRSYRQAAVQIRQNIEEGHTFTESLRRLGAWLPEFDLALLQAGEQSGRLDACFRLLADYYRNRARIARQMLGDLAYPVFLVHFAVFLFPFPSFFLSGNLAAYLGQTLGILLPIYVLIALLIYAAQSRHGETWRAGMESVVARVPILGKARQYLALARLAAALEGLLAAGVLIAEAWEMAATASGSPRLRRIVLGWRPLIDSGKTPAELLSDSPGFPEIFVSQYSSAEVSGKLEDSLKRLHDYYEEEGSRKLHAVAQWTPRTFYLIVVFIIAYRIVQFWAGYFRQIGQAGGF